MGLKEFSSNLTLLLIGWTFNVYLKIGTFVLHFTLPFFKERIATKMRHLDINDDRFYIKAILERDLGLFESYMDGYWTHKDLPGLFTKSLMKKTQPSRYLHPLTWTLTYFNLQTTKRAWQVAQHYDIGNDIYGAMLDKQMQYTCGYWKDAKNLEEAQLAKMELIAKKLKLKPGMKVLDIGCGFGTLAHHLAKNYGVNVVGCSISKEQTKFGENLCMGLPVEFRLCDYRDLNEKFDRIVSVGMFEHVGPHNYKEFFKVAHRCLKDDAIFLLHTIGLNHKKVMPASMFLHRYIFPNGALPYFTNICEAMDDLFVIEDWHNFGPDYGKTLEAWDKNFEAAWPQLSLKYGERFYRMWKLYLALSRATFESRACQLWQIVLSKDGLKEGYLSVR